MLELKNVTRKKGDFQLSNINFQLEPGYLLGILGKNGAGKTTLLQTIWNRSSDYTGEIYWEGIEIREQQEVFLRKCAYIADNVSFFQNKSVLDNARLFGEFYQEMKLDKFQGYLEKMEVPIRKSIGSLSRGQFFRFQLAFARARGTKLYLLDEPTAGMDPVFRKEFYSMLRELLTEDATILLTTHVEADVKQNMEYICILENGKMSSFGENFECV